MTSDASLYWIARLAGISPDNEAIKATDKKLENDLLILLKSAGWPAIQVTGIGAKVTNTPETCHWTLHSLRAKR